MDRSDPALVHDAEPPRSAQIDETLTVSYTLTATPGFAPGVFVRVVAPT